MALIVPEASLQVGAPNYYGLVTKFGLSRDWRPTEDWQCVNCEFIEPLGAIAPSALPQPAAMATEDWSVVAGSNDAWRLSYPRWNAQALSWTYTDGRVKAADTIANWGEIEAAAWCEDVLPRFCLNLYRNMPCPLQTIASRVMLRFPAIWNDEGTDKPAVVYLYLPTAPPATVTDWQYDTPMLGYLLLEDIGGYIGWNDVTWISSAPGRGAQVGGLKPERWVFEYDEDPALFDGGHILIRHSDDPATWWHYHDRRLRLSHAQGWDDEGFTGYGENWRWAVQVVGAVATLNLSLLEYGAGEGTAAPPEARPYPDDDPDNDVEADSWSHAGAGGGSWGSSVYTAADDWTVDVDDHPDGSARPQVTFTRGGAYDSPSARTRPVLWFVAEQSDPIIDNSDTTAREDTDGDKRLMYLSWQEGENGKGGQGEARFSPEDALVYPNWRENGDVLIRAGWQAGAGEDIEAQVVKHCYIMPGGLPRWADGDDLGGVPYVSVRLGAFDMARLGQKAALDCKQAGGMTVGLWALMVAKRLGIAGERVDPGPSWEHIIPVAELPSEPFLAVADGDSWANHIAAVERAANIRVKWNDSPEYDMTLDAGPPEYEDGVSEIALTITMSEDGYMVPPVAEEDQVYDLHHAASVETYRNFLKAVTGAASEQRREYYFAQDLADREDGIGDDWPVVLADDDADLAELYADFLREHYGAEARITWTMPLRVDLNPDLFVEVNGAEDIGIETGTVYRITRHWWTVDLERFDAESSFEAVRVFVPEAEPPAYPSH